jgi:hypothetical protein
VKDRKKGKGPRKYPRFEISVQLRPTEFFGKESRVQNISMGGVRIFGTKDITVGTTLNIDFALPSGEWVMAGIRVVWAKERPSQPSLKYDIGCRFTGISPESQQILLEHLAEVSLLKIKI